MHVSNDLSDEVLELVESIHRSQAYCLVKLTSCRHGGTGHL